ncbi:serine/arginine repetitive matrix protein 1-like isoform X1 [Triticum aestivum]|uniref:serine/arginine repetitive matrix protein 1-like isoform X1 n=1 Tax=Triticum aestivum TaxID=4565 RepID=UPI001D020872|nr:serine/arginine repetitive matrix protein 1-like isoform X1 [Triticum aestivum]
MVDAAWPMDIAQRTYTCLVSIPWRPAEGAAAAAGCMRRRGFTGSPSSASWSATWPGRSGPRGRPRRAAGRSRGSRTPSPPTRSTPPRPPPAPAAGTGTPSSASAPGRRCRAAASASRTRTSSGGTAGCALPCTRTRTAPPPPTARSSCSSRRGGRSRSATRPLPATPRPRESPSRALPRRRRRDPARRRLPLLPRSPATTANHRLRPPTTRTGTTTSGEPAPATRLTAGHRPRTQGRESQRGHDASHVGVSREARHSQPTTATGRLRRLHAQGRGIRHGHAHAAAAPGEQEVPVPGAVRALRRAVRVVDGVRGHVAPPLRGLPQVRQGVRAQPLQRRDLQVKKLRPRPRWRGTEQMMIPYPSWYAIFSSLVNVSLYVSLVRGGCVGSACVSRCSCLKSLAPR